MEKCKEAGCVRSILAHGLCSAHYQRWYYNRKATGPIKTYGKKPLVIVGLEKQCTVEGCEAPKASRSFCFRHHARFRKHGNPLLVKPTRVPTRIELPDETNPTKLAKILGVTRQRAHQLLNKEAHLARIAVKNALATGRLFKPAACERCFKETSDLEAHHWDYHEKLDVRWLCVPCHCIIHQQIRRTNGQREGLNLT